MSGNEELKPSALVLGAFLAGGLVIGSFLISDAVRNMRKADRFVTVKGLAEKEVVANLALWSIRFAVAADDLAKAQQGIEASAGKLEAFLAAQGFSAEEWKAGGLRVIDRKAREWDEGKGDSMRYVIEATLQIRTANVERMIKASQQVSELVRQDVVLVSDGGGCGNGPSYLFTDLNSIKPDLLAEATKNARKAAEQFAADSGSRVGTIRQANQGVISITSRDQPEYGGGGCGSDA